MTTLASGKSTFEVAARVGELLQNLAIAEQELASLPSLANPVSKGTVGAKDIIPGAKVILLGFGDDVFMQPTELLGYIRKFHNGSLHVSVTTGSIDLVSYGVLPGISNSYADGFAVFPDTRQGRTDAEDFLYGIEKCRDDSGQLVYPNVAETINLLVEHLRLNEYTQMIDYDYLEDPRTASDLL